MSRKLLGTLAVVAMLAASGCMTYGITAEVGADGEIETYSIEYKFDQQYQSTLQSQAENGGYENVSEYLFEDNNESIPADSVGYETREYADQGKIGYVLAATGVHEEEMENVTVTKEGSTVTYEDRTLAQTEASSVGSGGGGSSGMNASQINVSYKLVMPGEITNSSGADRVDGNVAYWNGTMNSLAGQNVRASSEGGGSSSGGGLGGMPFMALAAAGVVVLVGAAGFVVYRGRN